MCISRFMNSGDNVYVFEFLSKLYFFQLIKFVRLQASDSQKAFIDFYKS